MVELEADSALTVDETEQEHVLVTTFGIVRVTQGDRHWDVVTGGAAVLLPGRVMELSAVDGPASCSLASTPPHVALIRDLVDLEHAHHGFD
ncbi:hypothetical protein [Marmoricola sp. URHA0025 HA25]